MPLPRPLRLRTALAAAVLAAATLAGRLEAQTPVPPVDLGPWRQAFAVNALAIPFGLFSAEYEAALASPGFTIGVGGSWVTSGDDRHAWVEGKALYYPGERPFRGFSVGLTAGIHSARNRGDCENDTLFEGCAIPDEQRPFRTETAPTLGVIVNYDWLIGRQERFRIGLGGGAKRTLRDVGRTSGVLEQVYPDGRFVLGVAF
jgi:hypothetical protein